MCRDSRPRRRAGHRAQPGQIAVGTPGNGTTAHLIAGTFSRAAGGLELVHVPCRGSAQGLTDPLAGRPQFLSDTAVFTLPHMQPGASACGRLPPCDAPR